MNDASVLLALISLIGVLATGFFKLVNDQNKVHNRVANAVDALKTATDKQTKAMDKVAVNTGRSADAQVRAADESKQRNGHLGEQNIEIIKLVQETHKDMINAVENVKEQHVDLQVVDKQVKGQS